MNQKHLPAKDIEETREARKEKQAFIPATPFRTSNLRVPLVSFVVAVDFP
jgi:hypothetical protein